MAQLSRPALPASPPLLVVGMHRSGTSLVARLLADLGVHMGLEVEDNHEAVAFLKTNNELLALAGASWAKPQRLLDALPDASFLARCEEIARRGIERRLGSYGEAGHAKAWGFKDPRTTLTLPVWLRLFPEARVLHLIRSGVDVASSLCRRELRRYTHRVVEKRMLPTPGAAFRLWQIYVEAGCRAVDAFEGPKLTLRYEDLVAEPESRLGEIAALLGWTDENLAVVSGRVGSPSRRSALVVAWLRLLRRMGRIDANLMNQLGYGPF